MQAWNSGISLNSSKSFYSGDTTSGYGSSSYFTLTDVSRTLKYEITLTDDSDYVLFEGGKNYEYRIDNFKLRFSLSDKTAGWICDLDPNTFNIQNAYMHYTDGTKQNVSISLTYNDKTKAYSLVTSVSPSKDVKSMYLEYTTSFKPSVCAPGWIGYSVLVEASFGATGGSLALPLQIKLEEERKEVGLLKGLGDKISGMWNSLTEGFTKLKESSDNIVDGILNLPSKLWGLIQDGLKALFVPDPDYMATYKDKWDSLLARQLGAVYQVKEILAESWDSVMNADETNTIEFPSASINLPGGNKFTFGGYTVQVVPAGFSVLVTAIKSIIGIVCTIAFVNGMRKRYDEVMGVEQ